ncbi:MAG TPA: class I SAM-dependent methyltransferase [Solirubrobacteraceae bacterium]|nr:class I SAM-dependent methyltransferase [Solirubrobacteraceae bacterium]
MTAVIWHDIECGAYAEDLGLWRSLADEHGDPILDIGAGTGRVSLDLARHGHRVTALELDGELLDELARRAGGLPLQTTRADARTFELGARFPLCIVPMQTIQLLGGRDGRLAFLRSVRRHLEPGGRLAIAIAEMLDLYEVLDGMPAPLPDIRELDGVVYSSQPTAVRATGGQFVLERRRDIVTARGERTSEHNAIELDRLSAGALEQEGREAHLRPAGRLEISATHDYVGSTVVMFDA